MYGLLHKGAKSTVAEISDRATNIVWFMFVWLATILLTFLILEYLLNMSIVGLRTHMSPEDERKFREAKSLVDEEAGEKERESVSKNNSPILKF